MNAEKRTFWGCHGTDKSKYETMQVINRKEDFLPPDLGFGLYLYILRNEDILEPYNNAVKYLNRWKPSYKNKIVVKVEFDVDEEKILFLDDIDNQATFNDFYEANETIIREELEKLEKNKTFYRGNIDGFIIEMMLKEFGISVDAIIKETFTYFDITNIRKRSNIPNGKELCLRNTELIKQRMICSLYG